jgi:hypothetical protein
MPAQQSKQGGGGAPSNEQLTQFLELTRGLNREAATQELMADPDKVKEQFDKVKQLVEGSGEPASGGSSSSSSGSSSWDKSK